MTRLLNVSWLPLLLVIGCTGGGKPTNPDDTNDDDDDEEPECAEDIECPEFEICNNDRCVVGDRGQDIDSAMPIFQGEVQAELITPSGDVDYWKYTSTGDEWIQIRTKVNVDDCSQTSSDSPDWEVNLDTVITVRNSTNGALHAWIDNYGTGRITTYDALLQVYLPTAGDWIITVEDVSTYYEDWEGDPRFGEDFLYCLEVIGDYATTGESDAFDQPSLNIDMTSPNSIWSGGVNLEESGDSDWISVKVNDPGGPIQVYGLDDVPGSDANVNIRVLNESGEVLTDKANVGPEGVAVVFFAEPGTYLVEATDALEGGGADYWYPLFFRTRSETWYGTLETEANDTEGTAEPVLMEDRTTSAGTAYKSATINGALTATDDEDWFSVDVADSFFSVSCDSSQYGALGDLSLELYDPSGQLVATQEDGDDLAPDLWDFDTSSAPGTYTFRLLSDDSEFGPGVAYRCFVYDIGFPIEPA